MITDQEFLSSATEFAMLHNLDADELHDALRPACQWLQEDGHYLAEILEPECVAVCAMRDGDREPFVRVLWVCEDNDLLHAELRIFTDRQELHITDGVTHQGETALQGLLELFCAAAGSA